MEMNGINLVDTLRNSEMKAKQLSSFLAKKLVEDAELLRDAGDDIDLLNDVEKGILMEALEYATGTGPEIAEPVLDVVIECLRCEAPKVKWEAARVLGNVTHRFPDRALKSLPSLLENAKHKGTVVRWSAAYALGEMVKHNKKAKRRLLQEIETILKREKNNGVKNVYLKALKAVR